MDAGDHPPITPVKAASRRELDEREWRVYAFISRSFLGCISRDATYDAVAVMFESNGEAFRLEGKVLLDAGFLEIMHWQKAEEIELPPFKHGEMVPVTSLRVTEGKTEATGYLTEANLIARMEKNGIGTDASIATHINNICLR